ncbi:MAG: hypothetical protein HXX11_07530 [Desulfuromonadales bacterium]|nr:hypothetical protein [Desulfuromonadales bacterium]
MNKQKIKDHFTTQYSNDIADIAATYCYDSALANVMQEAITKITGEVFNSFLDSLSHLMTTGDDSTQAIEPKEFCTITAAKHLGPIIRRCPACDAPKVLHDLREVARLVLLLNVARVKVIVLPETETI